MMNLGYNLNILVHYSLIIDESTDVETTQFLGIAIKYYNQSQSDTVGTFLKQQDIQSVLREFGLDMIQMVGLSTDNANVMVGYIGGVYDKLISKVKHLGLIPCVCYSL